ncbi:MAG: YbjN domain-containing protein [Erythrobacter sp.]|nr:YbjN domain-containing protein [Erythrobacter sp.]NCQ63863.1 YbjN domain-containing protein [Alphaproteobacteria bacterium]
MRAIFLGSALALCATTGAQAQSFAADRTLETFTPTALKATLAKIGAITQDQPDRPNITVTFENGLKADALLMACTDQETSTGCLGTSILVNYDTPTDVPMSQVLEGISEYNFRQNFGRAYIDPEGQISLRMYIIADGGITMENYMQQLGLFAASAAKFPGYVYD